MNETKYILTRVILCFLSLTACLLVLQYLEAQNLNKHLEEKENEIKALQEEYSKIMRELNNSYKEQINNLTLILKQYNSSLKTKESEIKDLKKKLENFAKEKEELEKSLESVKKSKGLINPTYEQLWDFVLKDKTNNLEWSEEFDCTEFSNRFIKNFAKKGFFACTTELNMIINGEESGHILVTVKTDEGLYYIEPQSDVVFPADKLQVGKNYCNIVGWNCYWEITKISSCFELKL